MRKTPYLPVTLEKELIQLGTALSSTTRIYIIEALSTGPKDVKSVRNTVRKIQKGLGVKHAIGQPALSQQLKILKENEIVSSSTSGRRTIYVLNVQEVTIALRHLMGRINMRKNDWK